MINVIDVIDVGDVGDVINASLLKTIPLALIAAASFLGQLKELNPNENLLPKKI